MKTIKKKFPKFKTVDDEIDFWDKNDIPYQSLIKILLSEKVNEEIEILYGKNKKPIAKIVPLHEQKKEKRIIGILKGKSKVSFAKNFKITTDELLNKK